MGAPRPPRGGRSPPTGCARWREELMPHSLLQKMIAILYCTEMKMMMNYYGSLGGEGDIVVTLPCTSKVIPKQIFVCRHLHLFCPGIKLGLTLVVHPTKWERSRRSCTTECTLSLRLILVRFTQGVPSKYESKEINCVCMK